MKKNLIFPASFFLIMVMLVLHGCKKEIDYLEKHPTADLGFCSIKKFSFLVPEGAPGQMDTLSFAYNALGFPTSVVRPHPGTGNLDYIFRYDKQNRLTDLIGKYDDLETVYDGEYIEDWNRFFYDEHNNIILDSFYDFGLVVNGRPTKDHEGAIRIQTYEYDAKGRVIKSTIDYGAGNIRVVTYSYDVNGNIIGRAYDDKINLHRTNKIWMFLDGDYSVNNPFKADEYNVFELPEKVSVPVHFFVADALEANIEYSCNVADKSTGE